MSAAAAHDKPGIPTTAHHAPPRDAPANNASNIDVAPARWAATDTVLPPHQAPREQTRKG
jgi:hypothetical protein